MRRNLLQDFELSLNRLYVVLLDGNYLGHKLAGGFFFIIGFDDPAEWTRADDLVLGNEEGSSFEGLDFYFFS